MKHAGKAFQAALKLVLLTFAAVVALLLVSYLATVIGQFVLRLGAVLLILWGVFTVAAFFFFRDPEPQVPAGRNLVISPGSGKVDAIGITTEPDFMGGQCQRVSMFLSLFDVHVQRAPVSGRVAHYKYSAGQFLNAMQAESAIRNENLLFGFEAAEPRGEKIGVRLVAGLLARRIVPWAQLGDDVKRGERISLIQFGSRVDVYLPPGAKIKVQLGDKVRGGATVLAEFE